MTQIGNIAPKTSKIILVANKKDIENSRVVSYEEGLEFSQKYKIPFFETSAFNGENVNLSFEVLGKEILKVLSEISEVNQNSELKRRSKQGRGQGEQLLQMRIRNRLNKRINHKCIKLRFQLICEHVCYLINKLKQKQLK